MMAVIGSSLAGRGPISAVIGSSLAGRGPISAVIGSSLAGRGPISAVIGSSLAGRGPISAIIGPSPASRGPRPLAADRRRLGDLYAPRVVTQSGAHAHTASRHEEKTTPDEERWPELN